MCAQIGCVRDSVLRQCTPMVSQPTAIYGRIQHDGAIISGFVREPRH